MRQSCLCACLCVGVCVYLCFVCDLCAEHQWFIVIRLPRPVCQTESGECCLLCTSVCPIRPRGMVTFAFRLTKLPPDSAPQKGHGVTEPVNARKKILSVAITNLQTLCERGAAICSLVSCLQNGEMACHLNNYPSIFKPNISTPIPYFLGWLCWIMVSFETFLNLSVTWASSSDWCNSGYTVHLHATGWMTRQCVTFGNCDVISRGGALYRPRVLCMTLTVPLFHGSR